MSRTGQRNRFFDVEARVRQNVGSAGLAAGLLIFFGFFCVALPPDDGLWGYSARIFMYTLRLGGLAMAALAIWSSLGYPLALLVDAVVSCLIGASVIVTASLMLIGDGALLATLLYVVCGVLFISSGLRNGRDYAKFPVAVAEDSDEAADELASAVGVAGDPPGSPREPGPVESDGVVDFTPKPKPKDTSGKRGGARFAVYDDAIHLPLDNAPAPERKPRPRPKAPPPEGHLADLADDEPKS